MSSAPAPQAAKNTPASAQEPKARGANRSTKVAGKLKVLPDQPEPPTPVPDTHLEPPPPPKLQVGESSGTTGDSEDDDADIEEEPEDAEVFSTPKRVRLASNAQRNPKSYRCITR